MRPHLTATYARALVSHLPVSDFHLQLPLDQTLAHSRTIKGIAGARPGSYVCCGAAGSVPGRAGEDSSGEIHKLTGLISLTLRQVSLAPLPASRDVNASLIWPAAGRRDNLYHCHSIALIACENAPIRPFSLLPQPPHAPSKPLELACGKWCSGRTD